MALRLNQLPTTFMKGGHWDQPHDDHKETIERAAKALFEFVLCDESTKKLQTPGNYGNYAGWPICSVSDRRTPSQKVSQIV
jgi:hypothetical protein